MANPLKKLAGQTAIYGLPSIVGRLLNYLLVPLHTAAFETKDFGVVTEMYSYVAFLVVLLTFGMETAFFRFITKSEKDQSSVYSTIVRTMMISTTIFVVVAWFFRDSTAEALGYADQGHYVLWFAIIVGLDALGSIPLARLRQEEKAKQFAAVNIANIVVNIGLNLFFLGLVVPGEGETGMWLVDACYDPGLGVGYIFLANLIASGVKFLLLTPILLKIKGKYDVSLLREMVWYGSPMLIGNLAIIVNEVFDKPMLKWLLIDKHGAEYAQQQVGIYGACAKISILMSMFIQAFRYAAEPFFFNREKDQDARATYAKVMRYFVIICVLMFLGVVAYMGIIKHFISDVDYWVGLEVVPILLLAYICYGIWYNLSVWYKLGGKTKYGAIIPLVGAALTIGLNIWWIPEYGYMGSAWATLIAYASMMVVSYLLGQKHYPIKYPVGIILVYLTVAAGLVVFINPIPEIVEEARRGIEASTDWSQIAINTAIIIGFAVGVFLIERPKKKA